ncbi:MAG: ligase-associated DNA damage response exonuclease [Sphingomonadaceae bacterium]|uniref:ligase-associated DNA damage response exonuclease n=1 Tax=Thermaurantiacus sp. TaxID=2820283 RepID=UPI00298EDB53|nr:ligase-associated DNA damage response exonuclease [Thermaurantiacus sp.]MCS6987713.1 ligase-associated DNA damage response exonuclease [Sphingomonadaceae bacterium]MDW8415068.1 ligase-associated DNA damage response exonuclease [Thermaurantiacus sp.]
MALSPTWIRPRPEGIHLPGPDVWIDPARPVARAIVTHGHADHARAGHGAVWASAETLAIMAARGQAPEAGHALAMGVAIGLGDVTVSLHPSGHILGACQVRLEGPDGRVVVVTGDWKRAPDPTCAPFTPLPCDILVTEATFALPVFRHPPPEAEVARALAMLGRQPRRCLLIGAYALGKAQRLVRLLRAAGHERPIFLHGALKALCALYEARGVALGPLVPVAEATKADLAGEIVLAPPSALADRWSRRLPDPIPAMASGWMRIRARARQRGVELPLVISDHADWAELTATIAELAPREVWVTHGRDDALVHWCRTQGIPARALELVGREDEDD